MLPIWVQEESRDGSLACVPSTTHGPPRYGMALMQLGVVEDEQKKPSNLLATFTVSHLGPVTGPVERSCQSWLVGQDIKETGKYRRKKALYSPRKRSEQSAIATIVSDS